MRAHRVRFTKLKVPRATKKREGVEVCLNSPVGRATLKERLWYQYREQEKICPVCGREIRTLNEARFQSKEFVDDEENPVIHRRCANVSR
jgi:hypothetical protein